MNFTIFKSQLKELMYLDNLNESTKDEYIHEWYILFKEQRHNTVQEFVDWQFPIAEVNSSTHDFWVRE